MKVLGEVPQATISVPNTLKHVIDKKNSVHE